MRKINEFLDPGSDVGCEDISILAIQTHRTIEIIGGKLGAYSVPERVWIG